MRTMVGHYYGRLLIESAFYYKKRTAYLDGLVNFTIYLLISSDGVVPFSLHHESKFSLRSGDMRMLRRVSFDMITSPSCFILRYDSWYL
jgi:hypothetical protein